MTTLTLKSKYVDVLQTLGNLEEVLEQAVHQYAVSKLQARINEMEPKGRFSS